MSKTFAVAVAEPKYLDLYADFPENERHYYGCVTAMDDQVGRLNRELDRLGIWDNTCLWFCSDNGPEGLVAGDASRPRWNRCCGSTGSLRGRKRSLFNGCIAVPALLKWPSHTFAGGVCVVPCSTLDYLPTLAAEVGFCMPDERPVDGVDLLPLLRGDTGERSKPIPYRFLERRKLIFGSPTIAMIDNRYKYLTNLSGHREEDMCFDLVEDPYETTNVVSDCKEVCGHLRRQLEDFMESCRGSHDGADYPAPYEPVNQFQGITGSWL